MPSAIMPTAAATTRWRKLRLEPMIQRIRVRGSAAVAGPPAVAGRPACGPLLPGPPGPPALIPHR